MPVTATFGALKQATIGDTESFAGTYWIAKRTDRGTLYIIRFSPVGYLYCTGLNPELIALDDYGIVRKAYNMYPGIASDIYSSEAASQGEVLNVPNFKLGIPGYAYKFNFPSLRTSASVSGTTVDSNNNTYVSITGVGLSTSLTYLYVTVAKFTNAGALSWTKTIGITATFSSYITLSTNCTLGGSMYGNGTLYYQDTGAGGATDSGSFLTRMSSTGTLSWMLYKASVSGSSPLINPGWGTVVDFSGSYYTVGTDADYSSSSFLLKGNPSTGAIQLAKRINFSVGRADSFYVLGGRLILLCPGGFIEFDADLNVVMSRKFTSTGVDSLSDGITFDSHGHMYIGQGGCILKLPANGDIPGTGTYTLDGTTVVYANGTPYTSISTITMTSSPPPTSRLNYATQTSYWQGGSGYQLQTPAPSMDKTIIS